jgi:hypothetical protein
VVKGEPKSYPKKRRYNDEPEPTLRSVVELKEITNVVQTTKKQSHYLGETSDSEEGNFFEDSEK